MHEKPAGNARPTAGLRSPAARVSRTGGSGVHWAHIEESPPSGKALSDKGYPMRGPLRGVIRGFAPGERA